MELQWFPLYRSQAAEFKLGSARSGAAGATTSISITLDTTPEFMYGVRFEFSYELPLDFFALNTAFKQHMREGGVDDDVLVQIKTTQQSIVPDPAHVRNMQGSLGINRHPFVVPYPFRGGNKIDITASRVSSYPTIREGFVIAPVMYVTIEAALGVSSSSIVTGPGVPGSTGFPS